MRRGLDSSVGFKWVVPELDSDKALRLRDDYRNGIVELIAPDVFLVEIAHALMRAERQKRITLPRARLPWPT
jgi:predicted nucleic acid-binding protein